jgi:hypothetical protein
MYNGFIIENREKKLKAVSIYCLGLLERYDFREDNKREINE